jgi:endonuclease/exonuclease/phosphatase family metal-dependent hydrolase
MIVATWNVNNRVGRVRFRPEAAHAAVTIGADLFVFTEFFPQKHEQEFRAVLSQAGWSYQLMSGESPEIANRILIASRQPVTYLDLPLPDFDQQLPSNVLAISMSDCGLAVLGVRVPAYTGKTRSLLPRAWQWLEATAASLKNTPSVILGDLNVATTSTQSQAGRCFRRILKNGWHRADTSDGPTFFGHNGLKTEIDHILATYHCRLTRPRVLREVSGYRLAGGRGAISDHAALLCDVAISASLIGGKARK